MLYGIYFTFLLGYELKEKQYNIFPPGLVFFLLVTEKLVKKINGGNKNGIFPHFHIVPPWTMLYLVPLLRQLRYCGAWKWWVLPLTDSDNFSFNHFFFPVYFYQVPFSLSCHSHSGQYSIDNTPLLLGKQQSDGL